MWESEIVAPPLVLPTARPRFRPPDMFPTTVQLSIEPELMLPDIPPRPSPPVTLTLEAHPEIVPQRVYPDTPPRIVELDVQARVDSAVEIAVGYFTQNTL